MGLQGSQGPYLLAIAESRRILERDSSAPDGGQVDHHPYGRHPDRYGIGKERSADARRYSLVLTGEGDNAVERIEETFSEIWDALLCDLTEEEQRAFKSACAKIKARLNEEAGN